MGKGRFFKKRLFSFLMWQILGFSGFFRAKKYKFLVILFRLGSGARFPCCFRAKSNFPPFPAVASFMPAVFRARTFWAFPDSLKANTKKRFLCGEKMGSVTRFINAFLSTLTYRGDGWPMAGGSYPFLAVSSQNYFFGVRFFFLACSSPIRFSDFSLFALCSIFDFQSVTMSRIQTKGQKNFSHFGVFVAPKKYILNKMFLSFRLAGCRIVWFLNQMCKCAFLKN